ncbi:dTMP kinase [Sphingomonas gilva]|uniref:Thymidylate kinase n=1 Tax=Sphingomonas gilva TaxID=2305907 RepID=A0A396RJZ8_9SPHN|nr:dTMP kinase [Sphingomonas gilva]RHW16528.1 dTMP kinase [Sphingomonas gilva]
MTAGRFISLEGGEGVGKSTQARALADALARRGIECEVTREPGGSAGAEAIRGLLMAGAVDRWSPHAEALLFAAARSDHIDRLIHPAVEAGRWVICDRFLDSTRAYQGVAGGIDDGAILALHAFGSRGLLPDRTLVLTLPDEEAAARASARDGAANDRFGLRDENFHRAVNAAFRGFAEAEPDRFRLIDATGSKQDVTDRLVAAVADWLP